VKKAPDYHPRIRLGLKTGRLEVNEILWRERVRERSPREHDWLGPQYKKKLKKKGDDAVLKNRRLIKRG